MRSLFLTAVLVLASLAVTALTPSGAQAWGRRAVVSYYGPAYYYSPGVVYSGYYATPAYYYGPRVAYRSYYLAPAYTSYYYARGYYAPVYSYYYTPVPTTYYYPAYYYGW